MGPPQATSYVDLAEAQVKLGQENEAITSLEEAVELDPFNAGFQKKLVLRLIEAKQYAQAGAALEQFRRTFSQDSFLRQMLNRANSRDLPKYTLSPPPPPGFPLHRFQLSTLVSPICLLPR